MQPWTCCLVWLPNGKQCRCACCCAQLPACCTARPARSLLFATLRTLKAVLHGPNHLQGVRTGRSVLHHSVSAADGTRKFLLQLVDGRVVETVSCRD